MKPKKLNQVRIELLAKLAEYNVEWDYYNEKLIVNDLKYMQKQLAQHTNLRGLKYEQKSKNYLAKPEEIDILKIHPQFLESAIPYGTLRDRISPTT